MSKANQKKERNNFVKFYLLFERQRDCETEKEAETEKNLSFTHQFTLQVVAAAITGLGKASSLEHNTGFHVGGRGPRIESFPVALLGAFQQRAGLEANQLVVEPDLQNETLSQQAAA